MLNFSSVDILFKSSRDKPSLDNEVLAVFEPLFASSITSDIFLIPFLNESTLTPLWSAACFQRCSSSRFMPVLSDNLSI